jgi:hypothetical protein
MKILVKIKYNVKIKFSPCISTTSSRHMAMKADLHIFRAIGSKCDAW